MNGIDPIVAWNAILSIGIAAGVFIGNGWRTTIRDLRKDLQDLKVKLPEEYVSKKGLHDLIDPIREDVKDIKAMLLKGIRPES